MKRILLFITIIMSILFPVTGQDYSRMTNISYNYYSKPGFVNITQLTGAAGVENICCNNAWYYFGATSIFGYQMTRNFICGAGVGFYHYDYSNLLPVFMEIRYTTYLKTANPYFFADGGLLIDPLDPDKNSKVFFNPGIGLSRSITSKIEATLGAGLMIQMGNNVDRASFFNVKLGLIFRKYSMRLYKPPERVKGQVYE